MAALGLRLSDTTTLRWVQRFVTKVASIAIYDEVKSLN
jgi:hypothetical protein